MHIPITRMLEYEISVDTTLTRMFVRVYDDRIPDFEIDHIKFRNDRELHAWVQGIIATKITSYERNSTVRIKVGRHDRGWPRSAA